MSRLCKTTMGSSFRRRGTKREKRSKKSRTHMLTSHCLRTKKTKLRKRSQMSKMLRNLFMSMMKKHKKRNQTPSGTIIMADADGLHGLSHRGGVAHPHSNAARHLGNAADLAKLTGGPIRVSASSDNA